MDEDKQLSDEVYEFRERTPEEIAARIEADSDSWEYASEEG